MTTATHPYPSTLCDPSLVQEFTDKGLRNDYKTPLPKHCGYTLINDCLVPETFIQRVIEQLEYEQLDYGIVLTKEYIFEAEFLSSLDNTELDVLMPVVLQLTSRASLSLNLWAACPENAEEDTK